jgi:hypothetical protein
MANESSDLVNVLVGGEPAAVRRSDLTAALSAGAALDEPEPEKYEGPGALETGLATFFKEGTLGYGPLGIKKLKETLEGPEEANRWSQGFEQELAKGQAQNPTASTIGGTLGFAAPFATGLGEIGEGIGLGVKALAGEGLAARAAAGALGTATEMGVANTAKRISEDELHNNPITAEHLAAAFGDELLSPVNLALGGVAGTLAGSGLLRGLRGPSSEAVADKVAGGLDGAGAGLRDEAKAATDFIDDAVKNGATREQAAEAWDQIDNAAKVPTSTVGQKIKSVADKLREIHVANSPGLKEALEDGAVERATSAVEGEKFRGEQIKKFVEAGNAALRDSVDVNSELAFGMKRDAIARTVEGDVATHLDAANAMGQEAQAFLEHWKEDPAAELPTKKVEKWVYSYKKRVGAIAERVAGKLGEDKEASTQLYMLGNELKQRFGKLKGMTTELGAPRFVKDVTALPGETSFGARDVYSRLQKTLEDTEIFGKAGDVQRAINEPFAEGFRNEKSALGKLTVELKSKGWFGVPEIHSGKAASFLDTASRTDGAGATDVQSLKSFIKNQQDRARGLLEHAELGPKERANVERGLKATEKWGKVVDETIERAQKDARIKGQYIDEGHGLGHGLLGRLVDPFVRPLHAQHSLEHLQKVADRVSNQMEKATKRVVNWESAPKAANAADKAATAQKIAEVKAAASNPEVMASRAERFVGKDTQKVAPKVATGVAAVTSRAVSYLASQAPPGRMPGGVLAGPDAKPRYSDTELSKFQRTVDAVEHPAQVIEEAKNGRLSRDGINAIRAVYPLMYQKMQEQVMSDLAKMDPSKMPYEQKLMIGILLGVPADDTMTPAFTSTMQASKAQDTPPPQKPAKQATGATKRPLKIDAKSFDPSPTRT